MELPKDVVEKIEKFGGIITKSVMTCNTHYANGCQKTGVFVQKGRVFLICPEGHGLDPLEKASAKKQTTQESSIANNGKRKRLKTGWC